MLTARAEGFRHGNTDLDDAIKRLQAYEKAGADVLMAPGLPDLASVKAVCAATSGLVAAAREVKAKGTFGYVDTSLASAEVAAFMRG